MSHKISWDTFKRDCRHLANKLIDSRLKNPRIFGVSRGGMFVALQVAYFLGNPKVHMVYHPAGGGLHRDSWVSTEIPGPGDFIIDDIYDIGKTYRELLTRFGNSNFAVLYSKAMRMATPRDIIVGRFVRSSQYLYMSWEVE